MILSRFFAALFVFFLGALGGMWAQASLLPYLASQPSLANLQFIKDWNARTIVRNEVSQILVGQDEGISRQIEQARSVAVAVQAAGRTGTGFVATSDGLILTWASFVPQGFVASAQFVGEEAPVPAQVIKRDFQNNLALLKVDRSNLRTIGFGEEGSVKMGAPVFLVSAVSEDGVAYSVNRGAVSSLAENVIRTTMEERSLIEGAPLFDLDGRIIGLSYLTQQGRVSAVSSGVLREFLGL
ncbi:MAG: serine protease [bacterium]|nr:serine protease [bacterium]